MANLDPPMQNVIQNAALKTFDPHLHQSYSLDGYSLFVDTLQFHSFSCLQLL